VRGQPLIRVQVVIGGETQPVDGTSCAAPAFSGVVSLLNDLRMQRGESPLGFLNPWLYQACAPSGGVCCADAHAYVQVAASNPSAFFDVTKGSNGDGCCTGFQTAPGWDPVTGLGTPNYSVLQGLMP
jgi:tripeptidyl-peptidase-1